MGTTQKTVTDTWQTLSECGTGKDDAFILQNLGPYTVEVSYGGTGTGHPLHTGGTLIRAGVKGAIKVKCPGGTSTICVSGNN